jgi:fructan beta-fructosidase
MQIIFRISFITWALLGWVAASPAQSVYDEPLRPQFHFTAAKNWINDPNGLVYYRGIYHLFFQYNPYGTDSAHKSWGHATSPDLIHWTQRDTALYPDALGDMWSGSAVVDANNTTGFQHGSAKPIILIYTAAGGTAKASQCLAYSTDAGVTWTKYPHNPIIPHIRGTNRDPKVIWYAPKKKWILVLYLDGNDFGFFSSPDLKTWTQIQIITVPDCSECPDFFEMPIENEPGKTAWLWTSANSKYLVGQFDGEHFTPDHGFDPIQSEFSRTFYAAQTFSNTPDGRRIQIPWLRDGQYPGMPFNQQLGFPTELTLHRTLDGLRLYRLPIAEIKSLHGPEQKLEDLHGNLLDINVVIDIGSAKQTNLRLAGQSIIFNAEKNTLTCLNATAPLTPINNRITLRILVDRTSVEIFANDGAVSLSSCYLPSQSADAEEGGSAKIISCHAFEIKSAWTEKK